MPLSEEISRSVRGAFLFARFDARGLGYFNVTLDGFWRSFVGALVVLPLTVLTMMTEARGAEIDWLPELLRYAGGWLLFPLVMIPIARLLGLSQQYVPFVIAYNWMQVVQSMLFFGLGVLHRTAYRCWRRRVRSTTPCWCTPSCTSCSWRAPRWAWGR